MKRISLCLLVLLLFTGCTAPAEQVEETEIRPMIEALLNRESGVMAKYGSLALGRQATYEQIEEQVYQVIGSFEIGSIGETTRQDNTWVTTVEATPSDMILTVVLDQTNRIDGVFIKTDVKPEEGDDFSETTIALGEHDIPGLLTLPKEVANPPVVILISGSGPQDRNSMIGPNVPFKDIAHSLAKHGIATLRYDDRYYHDPSLFKAATIQEEMLDDVASAIESTKDLPLDQERIYLIGHSLGGMMIPKLLSDHPEVAGGISLAGTPRQLQDLIRDQQLAQLKSQGEDQTMIDTLNQQMDGVDRLIEELDTPKGADILGIPDQYWISLRDAKAANYTAFHQPMLILQGGKDFQVYPEIDYPAWQELFHDRSDITYQLFDDLNHLFMPSQTGEVSEYTIKQTVAPEVIEAISEWISQH